MSSKYIVRTVSRPLLFYDFRTRIRRCFRYHLKELERPFDRDNYFFYTRNNKWKYKKCNQHNHGYHLVENVKGYHGKIWQMQIDKPNYNLIYFYSQVATLDGYYSFKKKLDDIVKTLVFDSYYYEHMMHEISTYEKVYPFSTIDRKVFFLRKNYFEARYVLERILDQGKIFYNRPILKRKLVGPYSRVYVHCFNYFLSLLLYEVEFIYFIKRLRPGRYRRLTHSRLVYYYLGPNVVEWTKIRQRPPKLEFNIITKRRAKDMRLLIDELYDFNGAIHLDAINVLFHGHMHNWQSSRYFYLSSFSQDFNRDCAERIFSEIIYGYNIKQNKILNVFDKKYARDFYRYGKAEEKYLERYDRDHKFKKGQLRARLRKRRHTNGLLRKKL